MILCPQRRDTSYRKSSPRRVYAPECKGWKSYRKKHWEHWRGWKHIESNNSSWMLQTNKQIQHCKFFHTLFGAADEEAAIRRRVQRGCMSFDGSNNCAFWCYSLLFIPLSLCYLARDYRVQLNFWWNSRESKFCRTIHTDKSSSQELFEVACSCSPSEGSQTLIIDITAGTLPYSKSPGGSSCYTLS